MGEVYRATDLKLGQPVALKFLPEALSLDSRTLDRFYGEVKIARQVAHPNVCRVYDLGEAEGCAYLSMEYIDGEDLGSLLRRIGRLPPDKATQIARQLCAGLAAAHERGVIHRDLKPANIMLDGRGQVRVMDFGLAGVAGGIAMADIRSGTPAYMAPEQLAGREVSVKSDIYALGLVLYELFAGKKPFEANSVDELREKQETSQPVSLTSQVRDLDPAIERVVKRCLTPDPAQRPSSALAVAAALPGAGILAAALAAGETPSPELVAAAGETAGLKPVWAAACLGVVWLSILAVGWLNDHATVTGLVRPAHPPEVLKAKAAELVRKLGFPEPADSAWGFHQNGQLLAHLKQNKTPWDRYGGLRPSPIEFYYRESPRIMNPDTLTAGAESRWRILR
ncbi:MAG: serine/threonine protein kinase [Acidobacteria bacterium]|nr:serine/threonine protein kinase [Acidobacteriota bacterium]